MMSFLHQKEEKVDLVTQENNNMKVTIIEKQDFEGNKLKQSLERVCYPDMEEIAHIHIGYRAERIRLECEFGRKDIPKLLAFLNNAQYCFGV
jgi:hypothetical protein